MIERRMMFIIHTQPNWLLNRGRHLAICPVSGVHFSPGMETGRQDSYDVLAFTATGQTESVKRYQF